MCGGGGGRGLVNSSKGFLSIHVNGRSNLKRQSQTAEEDALLGENPTGSGPSVLRCTAYF